MNYTHANISSNGYIEMINLRNDKYIINRFKVSNRDQYFVVFT